MNELENTEIKSTGDGNRGMRLPEISDKNMAIVVLGVISVFSLYL